MTFNLLQHHKYGLADLENMFPFEREIYVALLLKWLEEERRRSKERQVTNG